MAAGFTLVSLGLGLVIPGIDNAAHVGLVSGALLVPCWRPAHARACRTGGRQRWYPAGLLLIALTVLVDRLPPPSYRLSDEIRAQAAIRQFLAEDRRLSADLNALLGRPPAAGASFEQLAKRIDQQVSNEYLDSFEQLAALRLDPAAPSAATLETLRRYAIPGGEASHALAQGCAKGMWTRCGGRVEAARKAPMASMGASAPRAGGASR